MYTTNSFVSIRVLTCRLSREERAEESRCNYERYRTLVKNLFHGVGEENALKQIDVEEMYPKDKKHKGDRKEKWVELECNNMLD